MEVKSKKTEQEFIEDLTTYNKEINKNEKGKVVVNGALPQVKRKPKIDKTINGMRRITY